MGMFLNCVNIKKIKFINFDGCKFTPNMFEGCSSLKSLDLSTFDTSNVGSFINLFANCSSLESLDLSSFNTSNSTHMGTMFSGCYSLYEVKLSNSFTMDSVTNSTLMFSDYYLDIIQNGAN